MGCSIFTGLLAASLFVAALSEVLARMLRTPVILLLVPMLIPEVPGEALYYTMYYLVQGYQEEFGTYSGWCSQRQEPLLWDHTCFPYGKIFYKPEESFAKQGK